MTDATPVLFISYYFPPLGGAGVQRSSKFARYLPDEGFQPIVVAGPAEGSGRWEPRDEGQASELPPDLPVHRPSAIPDGVGGASRFTRLVGGLGPRARWWQGALRETALEAARAHRPRLVYVSLSPFEGLETSLGLGAELDLPVVADLRDPWVLDETQVYPTAWHRACDRRRMWAQLARCARVILNTPEARNATLEAFPGLDPDRVACITNGYDAADFEGLEPRKEDDRFRIVHTGYLHTARALAHARRGRLQRALGGELCPVEFRGRSHLFLLRALERLQAEDPATAERVEVRLVGVTSPADREAVQSSAVANLVRELGYRDHRASVRELIEADLLFLPMHVIPPGFRARIVPGKTYEYLAAGRPVLAAVPQGDARDFVREAGAGDVVDPDDVAGMVAALRARLASAPAPLRELGPAVERFERRVLTRRLADVLREVL